MEYLAMWHVRIASGWATHIRGVMCSLTVSLRGTARTPSCHVRQWIRGGPRVDGCSSQLALVWYLSTMWLDIFEKIFVWSLIIFSYKIIVPFYDCWKIRTYIFTCETWLITNNFSIQLFVIELPITDIL